MRATVTELLAVLTMPMWFACTGVTGVDGDLTLRTSRTHYRVGDDVTATLDNRGRGVVYVAHCNHRLTMMVERRDGEAWTDYRQVNGPACLSIHPAGDTAIAAGKQLTETFRLEQSGQYRLSVHVREAHEDFGSRTVTSSPFVVAWPPD